MLDSDDPETFQNAPVCLQLVGRTLEEEAAIKMTEIVDAALVAAKPDSSGAYLPLLERLRAVLRV